MGKRTSADLVPVDDVYAADEELTVSPIRRYDWSALAEAAMARPGTWKRVDEDGSPSTASNINNGLIVTLKRISERTGFTFRGRTTDAYNVGRAAKAGVPRRGVVWIKAVPPAPPRRARKRAS